MLDVELAFDLNIPIFLERNQDDPTLDIGRKFALELGAIYIEALGQIPDSDPAPTISVNVRRNTDTERRTLSIIFSREARSWAEADLKFEGGGQASVEDTIELEEADATKE